MDALSLREKFKNNTVGCWFLWLISKVYGFGVALNAWAYRKGWKASKNVNTRVVCIGNITAGGTGKTTAVLLAATELAQKDVRVSIVSRGYKRREKKKEVVVLFDNPDADWRSAGDEPFMMNRVLSQYKVPIVIGPDRSEAAAEALRRFKSQVILLDDGFQHYKLQRDANIVLVDAKNPFGGGELLPLGNLREPLTGLERADLIVLTHCDQVSNPELEDIKRKIHEYTTKADILESEHKPEYYLDITDSKKVDLSDVRGDAACVSALGHPETFENTLKNLGLNLKQIWRFPDHEHYTEADLRSFEQMRNGLPLITTFKDFVKFPNNWRDLLGAKVYVLSVNLKIRGGEKEMAKFTKVLYPNFSKVKK